MNALARDTGRAVSPQEASGIQELHAKFFANFVKDAHPLPGAKDLLEHLARVGVPHAFATSGWSRSASPGLDILSLSPDVPVITRNEV